MVLPGIKTLFGVSYSHKRPIILFQKPTARMANVEVMTVVQQHARCVHERNTAPLETTGLPSAFKQKLRQCALDPAHAASQVYMVRASGSHKALLSVCVFVLSVRWYIVCV